MTTHMTKTWFVDGQIIEEPIPEAEMNTNFSGNLHEVMHQAAWDSATRVPEGDIRALKHRIHELEGEVIGYKQILDTQPEPAQCDGGQCGIGGYCKQCPKTQPDVPETAFGEIKPVLYQVRGRPNWDTEPKWGEWKFCTEPVANDYIKTPVLHDWEYQVRSLYTAPPQREWVGLTEQEHTELAIECGCLSADWVFYGAAVERKLKDKNGG